MKGLIILSTGFEDMEALGTMDVLFRAGIIMQSGTYDPTLKITSQAGRTVEADLDMKTISKEELASFDFLVIPGGRAVWEVLKKKPALMEVIRSFHEKKKLVAAICAAPLLLELAGILDGKKFTCFPGMEVGRGKRCDDDVVVDQKERIITARSAYYTIPFASALVTYLVGSKKAKEVISKMKGE